MMTRQLGTTGRSVGAVGLGCMGMSWGYEESARDDTSSTRVIHSAIEHGADLIDTADIYGDGHNEELLGRALRGRRHEVFLATKGGLIVDDLASRALHRDGSAQHIRSALEASLRRLDVDSVDLYYLHRIDDQVPLEETWSAMADLVTEGKARHLGLSEASVDEAARAHDIHPVTAIQSELSLWTRDALLPDPVQGESVLDWTLRAGAAFIPFAPLGRGYLTGEITSASIFEQSDFRSINPRFTNDARRANEHIAEAIRDVAVRHSASGAQVAIAWALAQAPNVIPIPGTKSLRHLQDNLAAADLELGDEDRRLLDDLRTPVGSRY